MKTVFKVIGKLWAIAFISFIGIRFYSSEGNQLPNEAIMYAEKFESLLHSFLSSGWFFVFFISMWLGVSYYMSKASGWANLAQSYSNNYPKKTENKFNTVSAVFGEQSFGNVLQCMTDSKGVYFRIIFPFSFGYKKLFISWLDISEIKRENPQHTQSIFNKLINKVTGEHFYFIKLKHFPDQIIKFDEKSFEYIKSEIPSQVLSGI